MGGKDGEAHWRTVDARLALATATKVAGLEKEDMDSITKALGKEQ
jgi:hypothetical protein